MKVKTNLSPSELLVAGEGLKNLAKGQRERPLPLENNAEKELIRRVDSVFNTMAESFQSEISAILLDEE